MNNNKHAFLTLNKRVSLLAFALREAFIALVPFFILTSFSALILAALQQFDLIADIKPIHFSVKVLQSSIPILVLISFSHQLAKLNAIDSVVCIVLSLSLLISLQPFNSTTLLGTNSSFLALLIPIFSATFLSTIAKSQWLLSPKYGALDDSLRMIYRYTPAFIMSYAVLLCVFILIKIAFGSLSIYIMNALAGFEHQIEWMLLIRTLVSHLITFVGVHGIFMFDIMVNSSYLQSPFVANFTAKSLINTFVIFGGVGSCLGLAISILLHAKDQHAIKITKIAMPFLVFNITEILLYGLPVMLNKKLFLPFILVPILNLGLALLFLHYVPIEFYSITIPWTTPIFVNGYLATNGDWSVVLFQFLLLTLDVMIYTLFVRGYLRTQSSTEHLSLLSNKLNISSSFQLKRSLKFQEAQTVLINSHVDTDEVIQLIIQNELTLFYQPIILINDLRCDHFEALLRLRKADGTILGPYFLTTLENAGLSSVIDVWVCNKVRADLMVWQAEGYNPLVSINIHPDTFLDDAVMRQIFKQLAGFNIQFEVVERAFFDLKAASNTIALLHQMQFKLAIDDFGTGYSSLQSLHSSSADTIKFDKQLLEVSNTDKGYKIYRYTSQMCLDLGLSIVAEGVETEAQLNIVEQSGVQHVQGWYFSAALPPAEAKHFAQSFGLSKQQKKYARRLVDIRLQDS